MEHGGGVGAKRIIDASGLQGLLDRLHARGYRVIGPTVHDGAIVYDSVSRIDELPRGWTDRQAAGRYRLERRDDGACFGFAVGADSWKRLLHPPRETVFRLRRTGAGFASEHDAAPAPPRFALLGARACEIAAIAIQDKVFLGSALRDGGYARRRDGNFIVAVNCSEPGGTCFCTSMGTGPKATSGFDLALTELLAPEHRFLVEIGTAGGAEMLGALDTRPAPPDAIAAAERHSERCAASMSRAFDADLAARRLRAEPEHARWDQIADRCLSCTNCTMVCPTCFCTTLTDTSDLTGGIAMRERNWDSCFTLDFSHLSGGSVRRSTRARYRQWLTHKLSTWIDQFGTSGCVGCGRCATWCPVGIDIAVEAAAFAADPAAAPGSPDGRG